MDHVIRSLAEWKDIWEERLEDERKGEDHESKERNIEILEKQIKAMDESLDLLYKSYLG